jgi:hypothetical protein
MAMSDKIEYRLTEEVVRWRFELMLLGSSNWWIAFTNPTAGPWKRLMGRKDGSLGEVYRFPREGDRPDVVAVDDSRGILLVVEAKDRASKLAAPAQVRKSSAVVRRLSGALSKLSHNPFWGKRSRYDVMAGLLWGRAAGAPEIETVALFRTYRKALGDVAIVGFETIQEADGSLSCVEKRHLGKGFRYRAFLP